MIRILSLLCLFIVTIVPFAFAEAGTKDQEIVINGGDNDGATEEQKPEPNSKQQK